jgi:hypothetical protein
MTAPIDLYRTANILVQQYGPDDALLMAAKRADALLALGDVEGQRAWKGVLRAVEELVRAKPHADERVTERRLGLGESMTDRHRFFAIRDLCDWTFKFVGWLLIIGTMKFLAKITGFWLFAVIAQVLTMLMGMFLYLAAEYGLSKLDSSSSPLVKVIERRRWLFNAVMLTIVAMFVFGVLAAVGNFVEESIHLQDGRAGKSAP